MDTAGPRERILAEATRLFYNRGIRSAGVDLVIAEAGVAKASFYRHFPSKARLVIAYLDCREEAWLAWLALETAERASTPREQLLATFDALGDQLEDPDFRGSAIVNAVAEVGCEYPEVLDRAAHHRGRLRDHLRQLAGRARCPEPDVIAAECVLLIDGALVEGRVTGDRLPALTAQRALRRILDAQAPIAGG